MLVVMGSYVYQSQAREIVGVIDDLPRLYLLFKKAFTALKSQGTAGIRDSEYKFDEFS